MRVERMSVLLHESGHPSIGRHQVGHRGTRPDAAVAVDDADDNADALLLDIDFGFCLAVASGFSTHSPTASASRSSR
jgi:hypothetical protein